MAIVFNQNSNQDRNQDDDNNQSNQNQPVSSPGSSFSAPSAPSSAPAPSATPSTPAATSSGRFNNISNYIKANQNYNKDGGGLAGKIVNNVNNQGQQVQQNVQQAKDNFNTQAQGQVANVQQNANLASQAITNPIDFLKNQDNVAKLTSARDAQYTGPKSLADFDTSGGQNQAALENQAKNFSDTTQSAQTENGRFGLLKNMFNRSGYNQGQQNLDNLLVQGNKEQLKQLQGAKQLATDVNKNLQGAIGQSQQIGTQAQASVDATKNQVRNTLNNQVSTIDQQLAQQVADANQKRDNEFATAKRQLQGNTVSSDLLQRLGLDSTQRVSNADLSQYISRNPVLANKETVGSDQDYAQVAALKSLIGNTATEDTSKLLDAYANAKHQDAPADTYSFNKDSLNAYLTQQGQAYQKELSSLASDPRYKLQPGMSTADAIALQNAKSAAAKTIYDKYGMGKVIGTSSLTSEPVSVNNISQVDPANTSVRGGQY